MGTVSSLPSLLEKPLVALFALLGFFSSPLGALPFLFLFGRWVSPLPKEPAIALCWGAIGGYYGAFSSSYIRRVPLHTTPVSGGGADNVKNPVEVARKPPTISPTFDKLYEAELF